MPLLPSNACAPMAAASAGLLALHRAGVPMSRARRGCAQGVLGLELWGHVADGQVARTAPCAALEEDLHRAHTSYASGVEELNHAGVSVGAAAEAGEGGASWRAWELLADAGALEEDLGALVLNAAGTREGLTLLQLTAAAPGARPAPGFRVLGI